MAAPSEVSEDLKNRAPAWLAPVVGALLGVTYCLFVMTPAVISPANAGWPMTSGDVTQHMLGWLFYRQEPWGWPIGLLHGYGSPIPTSIAYTDSIPLLAILFKLLRGVLPSMFQYNGLWVLASYALQGVFGALLLSVVGGDLFACLAGAAFFVLSPIMLFRLTFDHETLTGHWLVLAALWLALRPVFRQPSAERVQSAWREAVAWGLLLNLALWIHAYFWGMIVPLAVARSAWATWGERFWNKRQAASLAAMTVLGLGAFYWMMGLGLLGADPGAMGFGESSMNLNALINPMGTSTLLPSRHVYNVQQEGFNYLGLGGLVLALAGVALAASMPPRRATWIRHAALGVCCVVLFAFAVSNRVTLGNSLLFEIPIGPLKRACAVFRSSGRFFWPVYYLIPCAAARVILTRCQRPLARVILFLALALQFLDMWGASATARDEYAPLGEWHSPLRGPYWNEVARRAKRIVALPADHQGVDYANLGFFAATHGMTMNVAYLARENRAAIEAYRRDLTGQVASGKLDSRAFYVTRDKGIAERLQKRLPPGERVIFADGHYMYLPGLMRPESLLPWAQMISTAP